MKTNRCGKAEILSDEWYRKIKDSLSSPRDRLIAAILFYTGERIGAVLQLNVLDVYADPRRSVPAAQVTFPSGIRKGQRDTRQVPIHPALREALQSYKPPTEGYLFPSPHDGEEHLSVSAFDKLLRSALRRAGLEDQGISSHSFRRTFITRLHDNHVSLKVIQSITKHRSFSCLAEYIEVKQETIQNAIALLPVA